MADKYKSKYGTVINTKGLSDEQRKKVAGFADNKYGSKAAALADQYRKKSNVVGIPGRPDAKKTMQLINDKTGAINSGRLLGQMDYDPAFAQSQGQAAESAAYQSMTRDFSRDKARDLEASKQELAQRGIPIDSSAGSLWGKTTGGINESYAKMDQEARNQSVLTGAQTAGIYGGMDLSAKDSFLKSVLGAGQQNTNVYGINKDYASKMAQIRASKRRYGGGAGAAVEPADTSPIIGGVAPGFGV